MCVSNKKMFVLFYSFGYRLTRNVYLECATDYAVYLKLRSEDSAVLTNTWFYGFISRHSELSHSEPRLLKTALGMCKAKACSMENLSKYFVRLKCTLKKYQLLDRPQFIYNINEKDMQPEYCSHKNYSNSLKRFEVSLSKGNVTTLIACGNAVGNHIPPYFIFPYEEFQQKWLSRGITGTGGTSKSGGSNSEMFINYLKNHFLKSIPSPTAKEPILLIYDGHKKHFSVPLFQWAEEHHIIIFTLPAYTSHILQPLDKSCFQPFQTLFAQKKNLLLKNRPKSKQILSNEEMCDLGSQAYLEALNPQNLLTGFKETGISPFEGISVINEDVFKASVSFASSLHQETKPELDEGSESESSLEDLESPSKTELSLNDSERTFKAELSHKNSDSYIHSESESTTRI